MKIAKHLNIESNELKSTRDGFGDALEEIGFDLKIVALTANLAESTRVHLFAKKYPNRFFEVGVAEQNLVTVASGLAKMGKIPFATSFGSFMPGRCYEQIRTTIAYNNVPVKLIASHTGISVGEDGATHQAIDDIAIMRAMPNMVVISPCDYNEAKKAVMCAAKLDSPCYIRLHRNKMQNITTPKTPFKIGKAEIFIEGKDVAIFSCGPLVNEAIVAAKELEKKKIKATVVNFHTIKPLDEKMIINIAKKCKNIITLEDHSIIGGLGGAVAEVLAENCNSRLVRIGVKDEFGQSGNDQVLLEKYGLTSKNIVKTALKMLKKK